MKTIIRKIFSSAICTLALLLSFTGIVFPSQCEYVTVTQIIDGDTLKTDGGQTVRLLGIDTPETNDPRRDVQWFGKEATIRIEKIVNDKRVCLKRDKDRNIDTDKYGRILRYIWLDERNVNAELVRDGFALFYKYQPFEYLDLFKKLERDARIKKRGLWNVKNKKNWFQAKDKEMQLAGTCGDKGTICPDDVQNYVGKNVTVRFFVKKTKNTGKMIFLNSENDHNNPRNFTIVIFRKDAIQFTEDPSEVFLNKTVDITGKISTYKNNCQINVFSPSQIRFTK